MRDRMKSMKDPNDGGLLFCCSKRHTTGMLLTEDQIQGSIDSKTQKKKVLSKEAEPNKRRKKI
jgi:hypothetical protein